MACPQVLSSGGIARLDDGSWRGAFGIAQRQILRVHSWTTVRMRKRQRLKEPYRSADHDELLYDDRGLPPMIIETSALIAILRNEPWGEGLRARDREKLGSTYVRGQLVEAALVIDARRDPIASWRFDELLKEASIGVEPVTLEQARIARAAHRDSAKEADIRQDSAIVSHTPWPRRRMNLWSLSVDDFIHTDLAPG